MGGQSLHLPEEIIGEILSKLPVKSVLRLRCVSKSWLSLIGSKNFINNHLQNSKNLNLIVNLIEKNSSPGLKRSYVHSNWYLFGSFDRYEAIGDFVAGHCNGLLCILQPSKDPSTGFLLWNPATGISFELPEIGHEFQEHGFDESCLYKLGFGWDEGSGAYKVFVGLSDHNNEGIAQVYSSETNSWKTVEHGCRALSVGVFGCGNIHWLSRSVSDNHMFIEYFNLKSEVFGVIELPCKPEGGFRPWISERGGNILLGFKHNNEKTKLIVWAMKEYGVKESWVKMRIVHSWGDNYYYNLYCYVESLVSPVPSLGEVRNGTMMQVNKRGAFEEA